jgi:hypothetical protein
LTEDDQLAALRHPQRRLLDGLAQHPVADRDDEAALFGDRNELGRRDVAELGSRQRSSASAPRTWPFCMSTCGW